MNSVNPMTDDELVEQINRLSQFICDIKSAAKRGRRENAKVECDFILELCDSALFDPTPPAPSPAAAAGEQERLCRDAYNSLLAIFGDMAHDDAMKVAVRERDTFATRAFVAWAFLKQAFGPAKYDPTGREPVMLGVDSPTPSPPAADERSDKLFHKAECQCQQCREWIEANPPAADVPELPEKSWTEKHVAPKIAEAGGGTPAS